MISSLVQAATTQGVASVVIVAWLEAKHWHATSVAPQEVLAIAAAIHDVAHAGMPPWAAAKLESAITANAEYFMLIVRFVRICV